MGTSEDFSFYPIKTKNNAFSLIYGRKKIGEIRINKSTCSIESLAIQDKFLNRFHMNDFNEQLIDEQLSHCNQVKIVCMENVCPIWERMGYKKVMTSSNHGFSIIQKMNIPIENNDRII